ncbi:MAG: hypothetical protein HZA79_10855 [Sphingobacteriales bacterium]|nr:hypothetical protein [Sphingobacteriales bacterium]
MRTLPYKNWLIALLAAAWWLPVSAQRIVYSEKDNDDTRNLNFEIVGKIGGNFLVYKNKHSKSWITVLDNDMRELSKVEQDFLPNDDRMINVDFFPYTDHAWMIYQYQRKSVVYCMAARIDGMGHKTGDLMELDTTHIGFAADNKIYSVLSSEDKKRIGVFKINSRNKRLYLMTTLLLNENLELLKKSRLEIPMEERHENLGDFNLDNDGDIVFSKFLRTGNDNISTASFIIKRAQEDSLVERKLAIDKTWLDEIHIKVDNHNKRYLLTSFYYKERRGNIDGFYFYIWDKAGGRPLLENVTIFSDELRKEARGDASAKMAFNDYFIRNIITRRDGGFIIGSEAYYTTSRFNNWNRWDYLYGSPYWSPGYNSYYYSPFYDRFWWGRGSNQAVRHHADNIVVLSFDSKGQPEWNNVIGKSQFDDESGDMISYQLMNTGEQIHFLFNQQERRNNLLNDYGVSPGGEMTRNPTLKNLDKGYEFMPKFGKQVSAKQMIVPCLYRNYICFAKIDYN